MPPKYRMRLIRAHMDYITAEINNADSMIEKLISSDPDYENAVGIMRAGVYLEPALVQCAHAAVKSDKSPYYKKKYESLVKRRGRKRAIIAVAVCSYCYLPDTVYW